MNKEDRDAILSASRALQLIAAYTIVSDDDCSKIASDDVIYKKLKYLNVAYDLYCATLAAASAVAVMNIISIGGSIGEINPLTVAFTSLDMLLVASAAGQVVQAKIL
jgi:hypothetical protein